MALGCAACNGYFGLAGMGLGDDSSSDYSMIPLTSSFDINQVGLVSAPSSYPVGFVGPLPQGSTYTLPSGASISPTDLSSVLSTGEVDASNLFSSVFGTPSTPSTSNQSTVSSANSGGAGFNWNAIAQSFTNTFSSIAKAAAGANPTYQSCGPQGCTTIYGNSSNVASLVPSAALSSLTGYIPLLLVGLVGVWAVSEMMGKKH